MEENKLTISNIICPLKINFRGGVSPDIIVKEQNQFELDTDNDNQLKYAIKLFNHKICQINFQ